MGKLTRTPKAVGLMWGERSISAGMNFCTVFSTEYVQNIDRCELCYWLNSESMSE